MILFLLRLTGSAFFTFYFLFLSPPPVKEKKITIHFNHVANGHALKKGENFIASSGDTISIHKLKYYISHLQMRNDKEVFIEFPGIFLIDAFAADSIVAKIPEGNYTAMKFTLGVDSALHTQGVQEGALDPLNDMYWAWNTGYVNFKLEGNSPQAKTDLHRVEYHIGGFAGKQKTMQEVEIDCPANLDLPVINELFVQVKMEKLWDSTKGISITNLPIVIRPGGDAVKVSKQFAGMFSAALPGKRNEN